MKALFATWNGGGNLPPALAIAREIEARGGSARFIGDARQRASIEGAGFAFEAYPTGRSLDNHHAQSTFQSLWGMVGVFSDRAGAADVAASLRRDPVDVAVVDCMLLAHLRAAADLAVTVTLPELDPPTTALAGPGIRPAPRLGPVWQAAPGRPPRPTTHAPTPKVLLSLSTIWWPGQQATMQKVLDALAGLPVEVIATAGPAVETGALRVPENVTMYAWLDHAEVLPQVSLVIGHGGHGTAMRALAHDVPLLIIPAHPLADQPTVGKRIAEQGAGRVLSPKASVEKVRAAVVDLVADGPHRAAAARLGARIRERDGAVAAADALESLLVGAAR